jgi:hypothetical protein
MEALGTNMNELFGFPVPKNFGDKPEKTSSCGISGSTAIWSSWARAAVDAERIARENRNTRIENIRQGGNALGENSGMELSQSLVAISASAASLEAYHNFIHENFTGPYSKAMPPNGKHRSKGLEVFSSFEAVFSVPSNLEAWSARLWLLFVIRNFGAHPDNQQHDLAVHPLGYETTLTRTLFSLEGAVAAVDLMLEVYSSLACNPNPNIDLAIKKSAALMQKEVIELRALRGN